MAALTLEMAEKAVKAAQAKARELGAPVTATVVDDAGRLVLSARGDGTGFFTPETSRAKAVAAAARASRITFARKRERRRSVTARRAAKRLITLHDHD
jgi:uncharacterized protein GlcG (DUF336 family)